ncbi:Piwi-domain-containing protein [Plenodomus tracheiphilus IPT5]|uniref:Piwi-domain-containing protein n=1 Tax=Plenodomus tracheiphilus IPT5 TaxID=1408161 RepID=A0A6A7B813_9PLEO|nr:Piwi-domain-containing protein [Plenodomus tracheiphilus IPT5]
MSGKPKRRGGAFGRGNGTARGSQAGTAPAAASNAPPDISRLSLGPSNIPTAVDGSPLQMGPAVPPPARKPIPGNSVDPKVFRKLLEDNVAHAKVAEFPLRKTFHPTKVPVYTNHFALKLDPKLPLYEYDIHGIPNTMGKSKKRALVEFPKEALGPTEVFLREDWQEARDVIMLQLFSNGVVDTNLLTRYSEGKAQPTEETRKALKGIESALNLVISKAMDPRDSFSLKANKFFVTSGYSDLGQSLCTMRGYFYSVRPGMGQILLTLNACTSAFYKPILVSQFLSDNTSFKSPNARLKALRGVRVQLTYEPKRSGKKPLSTAATIASRIKTITNGGDLCNTQKFTLKDVGDKTIKDHFEQTYGNPLRFPGLPAINCGTKDKEMWYPPEKLQILPYQLWKGLLPESLTSDMIDVACHHPADTRALIEHEGLLLMGGHSDIEQQSACPPILIDPRMLQVPAAELPDPTVTYGGGKSDSRATVTQGKWNLNGRNFFHSGSVKLKLYIILVPDNSRPPPNAHNLIALSFAENVRTYGMAPHTVVGFTYCPVFTQTGVAERVLEEAKKKGANFVFLKTDKDSRPFGVQQWGNLMMKVNLKAGGTNHVNPDVSKLMADTLVLGADVTHPGTVALLGTPSIAAIVGSVDQHGGKFLGSMRLQPHDTACEDIKDVKAMVLERLRAWSAHFKKLPTNILYYRDGVADSQYVHVRDRELPQIRAAFKEAAKMFKSLTDKVKLTAVVVAKRHHVRFMPGTDDPNYAKINAFKEVNGNCKPGTLVDTVVTSSYYSDFYLISHDGIQGTAKPAHYFPLVNEMGIKDTDLQEFTHKLCYTYARATRGVSYAPPAYYADRLCERGRIYLRHFITPTLDSDLDNRHFRKYEEIKRALRDAREARYNPLRTANKNGDPTIKSGAEKEQEEKDEDTALDRIKQWTFEQAAPVFYGQDGAARNPFNTAVGQTMFWM